MKKIFFLFLLSFLFIGCVQKPKYMGIIHPNNTNDFNKIYNLSKQCFEKKSSLFSDGILVQAKGNSNFGFITFHRYGFDIGLTEPFIILKFKSNEIKIYEGPYNIGIDGYQKFNIKKHINRWIKGDNTCKK